MAKKVIIDVPGSVEAIEQEFCNLFNRNDDLEEIIIDFREVIYIEPSTSTSYLIAMLYTCHEKGLKFKVYPPNDNGIKIILYTWRFFEVLEEITAVPIAKFAPDIQEDFSQSIEVRLGTVVEKTLKYYKHNLDKSVMESFFKRNYLGQDSIFFLTKNERFFPLLTLNFSTKESKRQEFIDEQKRWQKTKLINQILSNNLGNIKIKDEIAIDVISETIYNAIIHSEADKFFTGSFFDFTDKKCKEDQKSHFTINFWDNGNSIIKTLGSPLKKGENIKSLAAEKHFREKTGSTNEIEFLIKKEGQYIKGLFSTSTELNQNLDEEHILLAAFFPGVSRLPDRQFDLFDRSDSIKFSGIGLSYLINSVINKLKGTVSVRTKNYFLNIKCLSNYDKDQYLKGCEASDIGKIKRKDFFKDESTYYSAKFTVFNNKMPEFRGNMITIRIPLQYRKQDEAI